jgi:DNA-binding MarR family transcriptional regulator
MSGLNAIIHQPVRLRVMSVLMSLEVDERVDFTFLKKQLELTDGNLGAHLGKLEKAGYVELEKTFVDKKPKTYAGLTGAGRDTFAEYLRALNEIIESGKTV